MPDLTRAPEWAARNSTAPESLVNVLDKLLDTGVVADGQLVLTVAGVDLIYVGLRALLASMDTASRMMLVPTSRPPTSQTTNRAEPVRGSEP